MLLFNKKINILRRALSIVLFLTILLFSFSTMVFANLQDPNDFDGDGLSNSIDATPGTQDPLSQFTNFNTLYENTSSSGTTQQTETEYTPLAPLPGLEGVYQTTGSCPLGKYLNIMIGLILGIAAVLAMVMIVSGGIQYMTSELISSKEAGKDQIKNAILGLLLALGAYLILNTINPNLLKICLNEIPQATITVSDYIGDEATTLNGSSNTTYTAYNTYTPNNSCPGQTGNQAATCVPLSSTNLTANHPNQNLEITTLQRLLAFDEMVNIPWYITEAWPPTSGHQSTCHQNGTCLDLNISNPTAQKIKTMIDAFLAVGMCPHYEVMAGGITAQQLISAGVPSTYIWNGHGTGPHFHVVNAQC